MDRRAFLSRSLWAAAAAPLFSKNLMAEGFALSNQERLQALGDEPLRRLAFGSCNDQTRDQSYWQWIARDQPQLWIWLGDNIYADRASLGDRRQWYRGLKNNVFYKSFTEQVPIIGTWDDHDYYTENADGTYADKDGSKALMLEFLDVANDDPLRGRPGVFQSYEYGPLGQRTQVILLDLRYFQDRSKNERTLLGELQWQFLAHAVARSTADLLVIGSSLNVCSPVAVSNLEGWQAYGSERKRFYDILASTDKPCILLSGDRHMGELYRIILPNGKPVYEIMSSGLTHAVGVKLPSFERQGEMVGRKNYGFIDIDWTATGPVVDLQIKSTERAEVYNSLLTKFTT